MKKIITFIFLYIFLLSLTFANDSSVTIIASWNGQTIKIYSSLSDLNSNINPITTLTANSNLEAVYNYNSDTNTTVYVKSELSSSIDEWWISEYILVSWTDNIISLWVWWELSSIIGELNDIKWYWFISWVHSLSSTSSWSISWTDKNDIANLVKEKIEESGSLLSQIFDKIKEIITRIFSIKSDTQKIN